MGFPPSYDPSKPLVTHGDYSIFDHIGASEILRYVVVHHPLNDSRYILKKVADVKEKDYQLALFAMEKLAHGDEMWEWACREFGGVQYSPRWDCVKAFYGWFGSRETKKTPF